MNVTISIVVLVLLFIGVIVRSIDWRKLAIKWVGNNPQHAQIYIKAGHDVHTVTGERGDTVNGQQQYIYEDNKKRKIVLLPKKYPYDFIRGRRIIGLDDEKLVANPLGFFTGEELEEVKEGVGDMSEWTMGVAFLNALKSIKRAQSIDWLKYVIIVGGIIAAYFVYQNFFAPDEIEGVPDSQQNSQIERPAQIEEPANTPVIIRPGGN